jgi:hypothetical protein
VWKILSPSRSKTLRPGNQLTLFEPDLARLKQGRGVCIVEPLAALGCTDGDVEVVVEPVAGGGEPWKGPSHARFERFDFRDGGEV